MSHLPQDYTEGGRVVSMDRLIMLLHDPRFGLAEAAPQPAQPDRARIRELMKHFDSFSVHSGGSAIRPSYATLLNHSAEWRELRTLVLGLAEAPAEARQPKPQTCDAEAVLALATELEATFDPGGNLPEDCAEWEEAHQNAIQKLRGLAECALMDDDEDFSPAEGREPKP
jgi:hypothetical protein